MGTVVLRVIVPAPLTVLEEATLGNRSPHVGKSDMNNERKERKREKRRRLPDGIERRQKQKGRHVGQTDIKKERNRSVCLKA